MKTLKLWFSPAIVIALWIVAAAFTLSQLATVTPSLLSATPESSLVEGNPDLPA